MEKTRVGIIGTGGISHCHMEGYKAIPELCDVVAVCDLDAEKVKKYAEQYNVPHWYTDYNEMLAKENLEAVSVCTWNAAHKPATIAALNAGCHVLCEKPMAMNTAEAVEMEEAAQKNGKVLQIGFVRRFGKDASTLKTFIESGRLGDIYYAKAVYLRRDGCPGGWFGDKEYSGGGPLIDLGVHVMDLTRYLTGNPKPIAAYGIVDKSLGKERAKAKYAKGEGAWKIVNNLGIEFKYTVEDFVTAYVKFDNGMTLQLEASFNLNLKQDVGTVELFGTKGGAKLTPDVEIYTDMDGYLVDIKPTGDTAFDGPAFNREVKSFIDCVRDGAECKAPTEAGINLMKIIDAIYRSAEEHREVVIDW